MKALKKITLILMIFSLTSFVFHDKFKEIKFDLDLATQLIEKIDSIPSILVFSNVVLTDDVDYITLIHDSKRKTYRLILNDIDSLKEDENNISLKSFNEKYGLDNKYIEIRDLLLKMNVEQFYKYQETIAFITSWKDNYMYGFTYNKDGVKTMKNKRIGKGKQYIKRINNNWILFISFINI